MTINYDLRYLEAGVEELKDYLLYKDLFWPLSATPPTGEPSYPKLTLGNLLIAQARLGGYAANRQLDAKQQADYERIEREIEAVKRKWRAAWEEKAEHEFTSRLRQWGHYLDELHKKKDSHAPYYPNEVRLRTILQLLSADLEKGAHPELISLDVVLQSLLTPGKFVWEEAVQAGFPQEAFWFLYGDIKG